MTGPSLVNHALHVMLRGQTAAILCCQNRLQIAGQMTQPCWRAASLQVQLYPPISAQAACPLNRESTPNVRTTL